MAGSFSSAPLNLQPSPTPAALPTNYLGSNDFDFLNQYLPDTYEKEFERFGNRSVSSFLRMVGAEMPSNSDLIKWAEQGRLHIKYTNATTPVVGVGSAVDVATFTVAGVDVAVRVGQTIMITANGTALDTDYEDTTLSIKGIVTAIPASDQIAVAFYSGAGFINKTVTNQFTIFIYGSEFKKGSNGIQGSIEAEDEIFENSPIILKDRYNVSGSDMAQIGWVEVTTENGATGYLWYLKSEHETRMRFDDYLETAMVEAVPAEANSGVIGLTTGDLGNKGSEGVFYAVENRGNVWAGGNPDILSDFDTIIQQLDAQGAIEENVIFLNRQFGFDIDDMLAAQNSYGSPGGTSYGLFDNDENMALNLGFTGFRRGYDFYKTDWKYLNDPTMRGGLVNGKVSGLLVPAGSTTVYDQILGKNAKRPFLHVRYRASESEDRRYKNWITGSAGGATNSDLDAMEVHFLSERCVCVLGANNFVLFQD